jgi:hypothetical protein
MAFAFGITVIPLIFKKFAVGRIDCRAVNRNSAGIILAQKRAEIKPVVAAIFMEIPQDFVL